MNPTTPQAPKVLTSQHRNAEVQAAYLQHIARRNETGDTSCDMCRLIAEKPVSPDSIKGAQEMAPLVFDQVCIIENEFPYENNDGREVLLHHMLVPKEHFSKSTELPDSTRRELHDTLDELLGSGAYDSAYTRSTYSPTSSVPLHLHTHLFKFGAKVKKQIFDPANNVNDIEFDS
jgi:hypothetical protein